MFHYKISNRLYCLYIVFFEDRGFVLALKYNIVESLCLSYDST